MKRIALLLPLGFVPLLAFLWMVPSAKTAPQQESTFSPSEIALVGARVYVSPFQPAINDGTVFIRDGKIAAVGRKIRLPGGVGRLDCSGMYIMAGFQNSHVHFTEPKWNDAAQIPAPQLASQLQEMFTRYGFTTVVDAASLIDNTTAIRKRIESGEVPGPRILTAGIPLYPSGAIPYYLKNSLPPNELKLLYQPATAAEAVADVDRNIAAGADIIKLFTGSWVSKQQIVNMQLAIAQAAVDEAHRKGKLVYAHPSNVAGLQIALQAHVDVLAHAIEDTRGWNQSYLKQMKAQRMWLIPTLTLFSGDSNIKDILEEVGDYSQDHEDILFGTDVGFTTEYDPMREYVLMQRAGLNFWHILDTLTAAPAVRFGTSATRGQIKAGMDADLVVVSKDPEGDIRALANVVYTFRDGRIIYSTIQQ